MISSYLLNQHFDTIIIGAGPAGLFAAAHRSQAPVLLLEKKEQAGKKLLIAGQGRCNITHTGEIASFIIHYGSSANFLRTALYTFNNQNLIKFFEKLGLETITDKNGKVFPASQRSTDVLKILLRSCHDRGVILRSDASVLQIESIQQEFMVHTARESFTCKNLLIATGGLSYPNTGSTGDGYTFAKSLGHRVVDTSPALTPVIIKEYRHSDLAGVSLTKKNISIFRGQKKVADHYGDIGFTHKGLSGPGILDFSRYMQAGDSLRVNFAGMPEDKLHELIITVIQEYGKMEVLTFAKRFSIPKNLLKVMLEEINILPDLKMGKLTKTQRTMLVRSLTAYSFTIEKLGGYKIAMVTHGGVDTGEISAKTMESKLVPGLYFAGEVMDIDGDTGGYNLQAAFSTAYLAACSMNQKDEKK